MSGSANTSVTGSAPALRGGAMSVVAALALVTAACLTAACRDGAPAAASDRSATPPPALGYAPARWRLAPFAEVNNTVLWVSHIVVRHRRSDANDPGFRAPGWSPDPPAPQRSPAEALERALMIAERARRDPGKFAQLAREYSDDVVTRDRGGSLGGVRAGQLPSEYRDALATLAPGETSGVVQSTFGFHVLLRRSMPAAGQVSGRRIAIRYRGTTSGALGAESARSRDQALQLARTVAEQARATGADFEQLVAKYSEHADAVQHGDLGVYSLRDPEYLPREVERLAELTVGEISEPLDSVVGFQILQRTAPSDRPRYAMSTIALQYDPKAPAADEQSRASALARAQQLGAELARDPSRFAALQKQHCCVGEQQWTLGRGPIGVTPVLQALAIGEIAATPVESGGLIMIPRRLDPATVPAPPPVRYELPNPSGPDFESLVRSGDAIQVSGATRIFGVEAVRALALEGKPAAEFTRVIDELAASFEKDAADPEARVRSMRATLQRLRSTLGPTAFARFESVLDAWGTNVVLQGL